MKEILEKVDFVKKSADDKKHKKLPSRQSVNPPKACRRQHLANFIVVF